MSGPVRSLEGRVAIVTGASRGIGFAIAAALAEAGARVALLARQEARLREAAAKLGANALAVPADVREPGSVRRAFEIVARELGGLDVLVNNAAVAWPRTLERASEAELAAMIGTNLMGPLHCMRAAIPLMRARGGGEIVNLSSESVRHPFPLLGIYAAGKAALETLSYAVKRELNAEGIRVTLLRSGAAATAGFAESWSGEELAFAMRLWQEGGYLQFIGTPMPPEVIAESVLHALTRPKGASVDLLEIRSA